jgi:hypothetical protein
MAAPSLVTDLVARYDCNRDSDLAGGINETQLRPEFIDPFFEALGWVVENPEGSALPYRDVILEGSLGVRETADERRLTPMGSCDPGSESDPRSSAVPFSAARLMPELPVPRSPCT